MCDDLAKAAFVLGLPEGGWRHGLLPLLTVRGKDATSVLPRRPGIRFSTALDDLTGKQLRANRH